MKEEDAGSYYALISKNKELQNMMELVKSRVKSAMALANKHKKTFMQHSYLWTESRLGCS